MRPRSLALLALLALLAVWACGEDPTGGAGPGTVTAILESPTGDDGAALIEFTGAEITDIQAVEGWALISQDETALQVAAVRSGPGEIRLVLSLADADATPSARVLQVVGPDDRPRTTDDYSVRIER